MNANIKPCAACDHYDMVPPFDCDWSPKVIVTEPNMQGIVLHCVRCPVCGAQTGWYRDEADAVEEWNAEQEAWSPEDEDGDE